jgi:hypothetical protein
MRSQTLILLACVVLFVQSSNGDEVLFKNGDHLTGKIVHLLDGKLVFKSDETGFQIRCSRRGDG